MDPAKPQCFVSWFMIWHVIVCLASTSFHLTQCRTVLPSNLGVLFVADGFFSTKETLIIRSHCREWYRILRRSSFESHWKSKNRVSLLLLLRRMSLTIYRWDKGHINRNSVLSTGGQIGPTNKQANRTKTRVIKVPERPKQSSNMVVNLRASYPGHSGGSGDCFPVVRWYSNINRGCRRGYLKHHSSPNHNHQHHRQHDASYSTPPRWPDQTKQRQ